MNRRALYQHLEQLQRTPGERVVAFVDLDAFKAVNDTAGHFAGDRVLVEVARCLQAHLDGAIIGRWGGDEFLVVLDRPPESAVALLEGARQCVEGLQTVGGNVTLSIGATRLRSQADHLGATLGRADTLLYEAKRQGRNRVVQDVEMVSGSPVGEPRS